MASGERFISAYEGGRPPWDIGRPQKAVIRLFDEGGVVGDVLDVGCGTGEHAIMAAERGHRVVGVDAVPAAIEQARLKARERHAEVEFIVHDALDLASLGRTFDTVIDSGLFHVFADDQRPRYVAGLRAVLRTGGRYHMLVWSDAEPPGEGPRRIRRSEVQQAFADGWRLERLEPDKYEHLLPGGGARAWLATLVRE